MALNAGPTIDVTCPVEGCTDTVTIGLSTYQDQSRPEAGAVELYFDSVPLRDHVESHLIPVSPRDLLTRYLARNFTSVIQRIGGDGRERYTPSLPEMADEIATLLGVDITDWD